MAKPTGETERLLYEAVSRLEDCQAYKTALSQCPEVCEKESNAARFLKFCGNDPSTAAKRLVEYWKLRLEVFGPDRCYLPVVDLSGNGALTPSLVAMLKDGGDGHVDAYYLPPDKQGRMVMCADYNNVPKVNNKIDFDIQTRKEVIFFYFQLPAQVDYGNENGLVVVHIVHEKKHTSSPSIFHMMQRMFKDCVPLRLECYHLVLIPRDIQKTKVKQFAAKVIPFIVQLFKGTLGGHQIGFKVHFVDVTNQHEGRRAPVNLLKMNIANVLKGSSIGLHDTALPRCAGGPWDYEPTKHAIETGDWSRLTRIAVGEDGGVKAKIEAKTNPLEVLAVAAYERLMGVH